MSDSKFVFDSADIVPEILKKVRDCIRPNQRAQSDLGSQQICLIMRGASGAGKSYLSKELSKHLLGSRIFSADAIMYGDNFFPKKFDPSRLPECHNTCIRDFIHETRSLFFGGDERGIVVDNTNLSVEEYSLYFRIAQAYDYIPVILNVFTTFEASCYESTHLSVRTDPQNANKLAFHHNRMTDQYKAMPFTFSKNSLSIARRLDRYSDIYLGKNFDFSIFD